MQQLELWNVISILAYTLVTCTSWSFLLYCWPTGKSYMLATMASMWPLLWFIMFLSVTLTSIRVSNHISDTTYIQTPISQEWKELWSPFLHHLVALVKCCSHTNSKATALNHVGARDKNVTLSDCCNNQTFVPNFRRLLLSQLKKTLRVPDVEHMIIYPYLHQPPNFSPQSFLNWLQWGFKWILLL